MERERAKKILEFAVQNYKLYSASHLIWGEIEAQGEQYLALGFKMDCGKSLYEKYGKNIYNLEEFKRKIGYIYDIEVLSSGIFSCWRFHTHWSLSPLKPEEIEWFRLAFARLIFLIGKDFGF